MQHAASSTQKRSLHQRWLRLGHGWCWVQATFLLAGWTKEEPRTHIVRLVDASKVLAVKETLQPVTSYHAYSVQPSKPQVSHFSPCSQPPHWVACRLLVRCSVGVAVSTLLNASIRYVD